MDAHFHLMMCNPMANTITAKCGASKASMQYVCMCIYSILYAEVLKCYQVAFSFIHTDACIHGPCPTGCSEREGEWMQQFWKSVWLSSNSYHGFKPLPWKHKLPIKRIWTQSLQGEGWRVEKGKARLEKRKYRRRERVSLPMYRVPQ